MHSHENVARFLAEIPDEAPPRRLKLTEITKDYPEWDDIEHLFRGRRWTEVDRKALAYESGIYPLLTDEAIAFYLPAILITVLEDEEGFDTGHFFYLRVLPKEGDIQGRRRLKSWARLLDPIRKQALRVYFEWLLEQDKYPTIQQMGFDLLEFYAESLTAE